MCEVHIQISQANRCAGDKMKCECCILSEDYRANCPHIQIPIKNRQLCSWYEEEEKGRKGEQ